ncbi:MAG: HEAT repeat domain-containing protein [Deltaproteobacteria bacterium]|nr:HEAT repeat domain-containing protein [Deltaproteobacteria bacterium]
MSMQMATPPVEVKPPSYRRPGPRRRARWLPARRASGVLRAAVTVALVLGLCAAAMAAIPRPVREALQSRSAKVRILGITGVAKSRDAEAPRLLRALLADPEPAVRAAAVDAFATLKDPAALSSVQALGQDADPTVRAAVARATAALEKLVLAIDVGDVEDLSDKSVPGLLPVLQDGVEQALRAELGKAATTRRGGVATGYGAVLRLRSLRRLDNNGDGVKCDVTLLELPGRILRFTSSATAAAGVVGPLKKSMERELALDGIGACAPSLARDIAEYVRLRAPRSPR